MPIRQKVRPLLLLRKQLGHFQRVGTNTLAIGNRLQGVGTGPGQTGLRALSLAASVGSDDVTVNFNEDVVVTDPTSGVSITVNGQAATFTAIKGTRSMVYTLTSQNPIDYDDVIVWTYDSATAGADPYVGEDSGTDLADSSLSRKMPSEPVQAPTWGTVTLPTVDVGQGWSTDLNTFITDDGGDPNITFSIASGALPAGISLNSNGTFSGTADTDGTGNVTFKATNSGGSSNSNEAGWIVGNDLLVVSAQALDQNIITVTFSEAVNGSATLGVTWNGLQATPTAPSLNNTTTATYTLQAPDAGNIWRDSVIDWSYEEATGNITAAATGLPLGDTAPVGVNVSTLPLRPPDLLLPLTENLNPSNGTATPSFVRNSIATVVTGDGQVTRVAVNEARFEGSTRNGENNWSEHPNSAGVLLEPAGTNYKHNSESFTEANRWYMSSGTKIENVADPGGGNTAVQVDYVDSGGTMFYDDSTELNALAGQKLICTVWARGDTGNETFRFKCDDNSGNNYSQNYALTTEWRRYTHVFDFTGSTPNIGYFGLSNDSTPKNQRVFYAFVQVEGGAGIEAPSSYIPTVGRNTADRAADQLTYTDEAFSDELTSYVEFRAAWPNGAMALYSMDDGVNNNQNQYRAVIDASGYPVASQYHAAVLAYNETNTSTLAAADRHKLAVRHSLSTDRAAFVNGSRVNATPDTNNPGASIAVNVAQINLGSLVGSQQILGGTLKDFELWNEGKDNLWLAAKTQPDTPPDDVPDTPVIDSIDALDGALRVNYSHPGPFNYAEFYDGGLSGTSLGYDNDTDRQMILQGLTNGQSYTVSMRVFSQNDYTPSLESNAIVQTPNVQAPVLNAPTGFTVTPGSATASTLDVTWTPPAQGTATGYRIKDGANVVGTASWGASGARITGLDPSTAYTLHVVTTDGTNESSASNTDTGTTTAPGVFVPNVFSINNAKYSPGQNWTGPGQIDGTTIDGWSYLTSGQDRGAIVTDVYNPLTGGRSPFAEAPPNGLGRAFEWGSPNSGYQYNQNIGFHIWPNKQSLNGKVMMFQAMIYDPAGYDYGQSAPAAGARKMHRFEIQGDTAGDGDYALRHLLTEGPAINGGTNFTGKCNYHCFVSGSNAVGSPTYTANQMNVGFNLNMPTLLFPGGPAAQTVYPANRWNVWHFEIVYTTAETGRLRIWFNQQLALEINDIRTLNLSGLTDGAYKWCDPWNSGQRQGQYQYLDQHHMHVNSGSISEWPFGNQHAGVPDIVIR